MELMSSVWHLFSVIAIWLIGLLVALEISRKFLVGRRRGCILYIWHSIFCVVYANYVISAGGDAIEYYQSSLAQDIDVSVGTAAIVIFTRIFSYYLEFSFLGVFLVFNIFGAIGLIAIDGSLRQISFDKSRLIQSLMSLTVFLPSISFWSSAIGKDAFSFMSAALFLWAALSLRKRIFLLFFAIVVMLFVRPHMAALMLASFVGSMIFRKDLSLAKRLLLFFFSFAGALFLVPFALEYSGLNSGIGAEQIENYVQERQGYNQDGGGGIDISSMSLPMQLFTYLFRPLPFEASNFLALAASLDNLVLLCVFLFGAYGFFKNLKNKRAVSEYNKSLLWIYSVASWIILSVTTANLGISIRQKWMFAPVLIFLFVSMLVSRRKEVD